MSRLMIRYDKYTNYDKLELLNWDFNKPTKDDGIYIAKLNKPIYMIIPKSEILEIYEEPITGFKRLKYIINTKKHKKFMTFCDNMDSLCIELASENSSKWFNKTIDKRKMVELYNKIYNKDDIPDDYGIYNTTFDIRINDIDLIDDLMLYNDTNEMNIMISINGIEFYKQTFQWNITILKVIEEMVIEEVDKYSNQVIKNTTDNNIFLEKKLTKSEDIVEDIVENIENNIFLEKRLTKSEDIEEDMNKDVEEVKEDNVDTIFCKNQEIMGGLTNEVINELMDGVKLTDDMIDNYKNDKREEREDKRNKKEDMTSRIELESIISQKSEDFRRILLNAERARRSADMLHQKAKYLGEELNRYKIQLNHL